MGTFHSIDELIKTLDREKVLLKEMFAKRHSLQFRYDYALEMTEYKEERIRYLIENGVIRDTGDWLETDSNKHLRAHEPGRNIVSRLLLEKKKKGVGVYMRNMEKAYHNK